MEEGFTDEAASCTVIGKDAYAMLLVKSRFVEFADEQMCDPSMHTETILAISSDTCESVDALVGTTPGAGGTSAGEPQDHGFMYSRSFHDPDGHREVVWMDPAVIAEALEATASAS